MMPAVSQNLNMDTHRITFLDISTLDAGDVDLSPFESLGSFDSFPVTSPDEVVERLQSTDVVLTNKVILGAAEINACPNLKMIQLAATGYNNVDLDAARAKGIRVCNVAGYSSDSVAQHTFGLLINLASSIHRLATETALWPESPIFSRLTYPATELSGKTLGIAGSGDIGQRVAKIAEALGMKIQFLAREGGSTEGNRVDRETFFSQSDAISLHCPLTDSTRHMIDADSLAMMKPSAFLINTGRGDLIDEQALTEALKSGQIAGAGLDVLSAEPPPADNPLIELAQSHPDRLIITPHSAWSSLEARTRLVEGMVSNIKDWQAGRPGGL